MRFEDKKIEGNEDKNALCKEYLKLKNAFESKSIIGYTKDHKKAFNLSAIKLIKDGFDLELAKKMKLIDPRTHINFVNKYNFSEREISLINWAKDRFDEFVNSSEFNSFKNFMTENSVEEYHRLPDIKEIDSDSFTATVDKSASRKDYVGDYVRINGVDYKL